MGSESAETKIADKYMRVFARKQGTRRDLLFAGRIWMDLGRLFGSQPGNLRHDQPVSSPQFLRADTLQENEQLRF